MKISEILGRPVRAFHGTNQKFDKFDLSKRADPRGLFFTPHQTYAAKYGDTTHAVDLHIQNPYEVSHDQRQDNWQSVPPNHILKRMGHDAIKVVRDPDADPNSMDSEERANDVYLPFRNRQIKIVR